MDYPIETRNSDLVVVNKKKGIIPDLDLFFFSFPYFLQSSLSTLKGVQKRLARRYQSTRNSSESLGKSCGQWIISHPTTLSPRVENVSLLFCYFYGKCSDEFRSLIPLVQTFTSKTRYDTNTGSNHPPPHSFRISLLRSKFHWNSFFSLSAIFYETDSREDTSGITINLTPSLASTVICFNLVTLYLELPIALVIGENYPRVQSGWMYG